MPAVDITLLSSGMCRHVVWFKCTDVTEETAGTSSVGKYLPDYTASHARRQLPSIVSQFIYR
jgi:hypothetical protein